MPLHIDHISLASPHIFRSADTLAKETGLGYWTGEWLRESSVNIVPLGPPGNFIEISGIIGIFSLRQMNERRQWLLDITETGDHFNGLCLGVDTMEELEAFAKHWKSTVNRADDPDSGGAFSARQRLHPADGLRTGDQAHSVDAGTAQHLLLPRPHAALQRSADASDPENQVRPTGIKWVEVRGPRSSSRTGGRHAVRGDAAAEAQRKSLGVSAVSVGAKATTTSSSRRPAASDAVPRFEVHGLTLDREDQTFRTRR